MTPERIRELRVAIADARGPGTGLEIVEDFFNIALKALPEALDAIERVRAVLFEGSEKWGWIDTYDASTVVEAVGNALVDKIAS